MSEDNVQRQRHQDNLLSMEMLNRRIDSLGERVNSLSGRIDSVKENTDHLDECLDRFQETFKDMAAKFTTMYDSLKMFHSPKKWAQDNWIVVIGIIFLISFIPNLPSWVGLIASTLTSAVGIEHHG
jgi:hypothetical protein